ncbi:DUF7230 family protein [Paludibacterium paludis]|uniref:DUF7230 family protein n=1 Tax=Paludibacterium paludis TaxID=1225769 RepID=UPI003CC82BDF
MAGFVYPYLRIFRATMPLCRPSIDLVQGAAMKKTPRLNPVARFAGQLNRCRTFVDRKKRAKSGHQKHKGREVFLPSLVF